MSSLINQPRLDAAESAFFARQLEFIYTTTYDIKFADLKSRSFIPVSTQANPGAKSITYRQFTEVGVAKVIGDNARDLPRVDVNGIEFTRPVRWVGAAYGWTVQDVKAAAMAGFDLNPRRATATRRAIERKLDEIAAVGEPLHGIATGFLNDADVTIDAATGNWTALTADQIIADVSTMLQGISTDSLGVETADTLILPDGQWALIATLPRATVSDTTVLEFMRRSFPNLTAIEPWHRLDGAGAGGVDRAVLYRRASDVLTQEIPNDFEQLPVQEQGVEFIVNAMAATAGTAIYYPVAVRFLDGL